MRGIWLSADQLDEWAGRELSDAELDVLAEAIPNSSIPEAVSTIVSFAIPRFVVRKAVRLPGFSQDDGMPDRGRRYGGAQTVHNTGTIDVVTDESGRVVEVWFRCCMLRARVSVEGQIADAYETEGESLVAVELAEGEA